MCHPERPADPPSVRDWLAEIDPEMRLFDGLDEAIIGCMSAFGRPIVVLYDRERALACLMAQGMDEEEAIEYFEFNVAGAWIGDYTPAFAILMPSDLSP
jgi:hypothetical protein